MSATGPYASVASVTPSVDNIPTAEMAMPYKPPITKVERIVKTITMVGGKTEIMPMPKPWMPDAPKLHTLKIALMKTSSAKDIQDSIESRFGLRIVGVSEDGRAITINGKNIKLKGFNRHDMYPQFGPSLPVSIYNSDLALLKVLRFTPCSFLYSP